MVLVLFSMTPGNTLSVLGNELSVSLTKTGPLHWVQLI
jgi:hypothetical protein